MKRGYDRTQRISDLIQKTLAQIIVEDNQFGFVTITGATVTRDLAHAKVYVSVLSEEQESIKETVAALNRSQKALRYELAHRVKLRIVPELKFIYDESTAHGFHISNLINKAIKK